MCVRGGQEKNSRRWLAHEDLFFHHCGPSFERGGMMTSFAPTLLLLWFKNGKEICSVCLFKYWVILSFMIQAQGLPHTQNKKN